VGRAILFPVQRKLNRGMVIIPTFPEPVEIKLPKRKVGVRAVN